jgi:2-dehydro-3-deoxygluconokinase
VAFVHDMLVHSQEGFLRLFPAWPANQSAAFAQLRMRGALLVSAAYAGQPAWAGLVAGRAGGTVNATILALAGGAPVSLLSPWPDAPTNAVTVVDRTAGNAPVTLRWSSVAGQFGGPLMTFDSARGHEFLYYRASSAAAAMTVADVPEALIAGAKIFYTSGISQGISASAADAVFHAIAVARRSGVTVAYDTNYRPRLWPVARAAAVIHAAIAQCDIALPSLEDAQALTALGSPDAICDHYLRLGPRLVVLKMGANGALLATPEGRVAIAPFACTPVDGTGAGDTFCGSFLARLIAGDAPEAAARYAGVAAALKTEGYGAVAPIPRADAVLRALGA